MKIILITTLIIVLGGLSWLLIRWFERSRIYYPDPLLESTPADIGLIYEDVTVTTSDKVRIHGWWIPANDNRGTILFCHGNAGNISHRLESIRIFHQLGMNVFIFDYRGYGKSAGSPSEKGTYRDSDAAYDYLHKIRKIAPEKIIIFGRSLGGAVAVELAGEKEAGALICESSFTSAVDMGKLVFPYLPVKLLVFDRYDSISRVGELSLPKLFIHSREDDLIPFEQGERLYQAAGEPKKFLEIRGDHNEGFLESEEIYRETIDEFLREINVEDR
ncbi:MAG: alpha/beta hydrolase [Candidatus Auribacterota bacterium]|nr:alpha/beta hydrolase [Candidatus Auribacterota bacterium]